MGSYGGGGWNLNYSSIEALETIMDDLEEVVIHKKVMVEQLLHVFS